MSSKNSEEKNSGSSSVEKSQKKNSGSVEPNSDSNSDSDYSWRDHYGRPCPPPRRGESLSDSDEPATFEVKPSFEFTDKLRENLTPSPELSEAIQRFQRSLFCKTQGLQEIAEWDGEIIYSRPRSDTF